MDAVRKLFPCLRSGKWGRGFCSAVLAFTSRLEFLSRPHFQYHSLEHLIAPTAWTRCCARASFDIRCSTAPASRVYIVSCFTFTRTTLNLTTNRRHHLFSRARLTWRTPNVRSRASTDRTAQQRLPSPISRLRNRPERPALVAAATPRSLYRQSTLHPSSRPRSPGGSAKMHLVRCFQSSHTSERQAHIVTGKYMNDFSTFSKTAQPQDVERLYKWL